MKNVYETDAYLTSISTSVEDVCLVKKSPALCLRENIFYPGGGGQPSDLGEIRLSTGQNARVNRVLKQHGRIYACLDQKLLVEPDAPLEALIDWPRRHVFMRYHTGAHVLMGAVKRKTDNYVPQGVAIAEDASACTVRFSATWEPTDAAVTEILALANEKVGEDRPVKCIAFASLAVARQELGSIYRGPDDMTGEVRIAVIADWDANPCGGTHLRSLSEVGPLKVESFGNDYIQMSISSRDQK